MKQHIKLALLFVLLGFSGMHAQQESTFTLYRFHMNIINPAYAGAENATLLSSSWRKQWTNIADAPETQAVSFGMPTGEKVGLGLTFLNDRSFVERQTFLAADFSYRLNLGEAKSLYLGLKAGGNFYSLNTSGLETYNINSDPSLRDISSFSPNVGVGAFFLGSRYFISVSVPRILSSEKARTENGTASAVTDRPHIYLGGGYFLPVNMDLTFEPTMMLRHVSGAPTSLELTATMDYRQQLKGGIAYRTDNSLAGLVSLNIKDTFDLGYAYELILGNSAIANAGSTHEIFLRYRFRPSTKITACGC